MTEKCCGTCRYCRRSEETGEWVCINDLSDDYALKVDHRYKCEEYEGRE